MVGRREFTDQCSWKARSEKATLLSCWTDAATTRRVERNTSLCPDGARDADVRREFAALSVRITGHADRPGQFYAGSDRVGRRRALVTSHAAPRCRLASAARQLALGGGVVRLRSGVFVCL